MQLKLLNLATGLLAVSSVQALVIPRAQSSSSDVVASLTSLAKQADASTLVINKLKPGNILSTGLTVIGEVTKVLSSLTKAGTALRSASASTTTTDTTTQQNVCTLVKTVTDSATGLLTTLNANLSKLVGSILAIPLSAVVGLLRSAFSGLQTQVQVNSPSCAPETDAGFDLISTLLNTLTLTN
ncbi:hypothetical protein B0J13DRAFT_617172 [Dactylonectria estremocensis]|uniref:Uncharacterized protein n=1 Tax=Dactylonectria estremocensis TaxID=1079267 RepID=A0A9P9FEK8_9HYPO|nr:hypothetical protein B0J13DRAFT_617172 [Dactylonectria estremocensis]